MVNTVSNYPGDPSNLVVTTGTTVIPGYTTINTQLYGEYIPGLVGSTYRSLMNQLKAILNNTLDAPSWDADAFSQGYDNIIRILQSFQAFGQNGMQDPASGISFKMTPEMANALSQVFQTLQAVGLQYPPQYPVSTTYPGGIDPNLGPKTTIIENWQSLSGFGVNTVLENALNVNTSARSLQSLIELEYVKAGNDQIYNQLISMQASLGITQNVIDALTAILQVSNQITVAPAGNFAFPPVTLGDIPESTILWLFSLQKDSSKNSGNVYFQPVSDGSIVIQSTGDGATHGGHATRFDAGSNWLTRAYYLDWINAGGGYTAVNTNDLGGQIDFEANGEESLVLVTLNWNQPPPASALARQHRFASTLNALMNNYNNTLTIGTDGFGNDTLGDSKAFFTLVYKTLTSAHFTQVFPTAAPTATALSQLLTAKSALMKAITDIEAQTPSQGRTTINSLAYLCYNVVKDISTSFTNATSQAEGLNNWILDGQQNKISGPLAGAAGSIQNNITLASQSAQSSNTTQQQNVQNFMFMFQQFYQSASNVLQKVSQLIETTAQNINR